MCVITSAMALCACDGAQSALNVAGTHAERIASLFWWMVAGGALIWLLVVALAVYATHIRPGRPHPRLALWLIVGGGVAFPVVVLTVLLVGGLIMMPQLRAPPGEADLQIAVSGEQWWWRVSYFTAEGPVELANEIRLPVQRRVTFVLSSPDVIHSFWIPPLGGKMDMIPGRVTYLTLEPTREGVFRGVCAEYCGASHAFMAFPVVVMAQEAFDQWLEAQAAPAAPPQNALARRGQQAFLANGCGACHTVRGTAADGGVGPDLTHVGSRLSLAAGVLDNGHPFFVRWLVDTARIKPGVHMPAFGMLPEAQVDAIAAYLETLQ
ncbi:MAG: cytochrome c oxidase subunit II [Thiohalomonadaceae bacterium]